jgi:hypothetical protein
MLQQGMENSADIPVHFFTIVLNGEPFIRHHLDVMNALPFRWHWHVIEGLANLTHDMAWSLQFGASLPTGAASDGRSTDGTSEYLDRVAHENSNRMTIYRHPRGDLWDGKREMISAPLQHIPEPCLLWEIDADELWTTDQMIRVRELFQQNPDRSAAVFNCWFFVGPDLVIDRRHKYAEIQWRRVWRYEPGMRWYSHEPPILVRSTGEAHKWLDVAAQNPFTAAETENAGLTFQHFAYATESQLLFKEHYYGYRGITEQWRKLQQCTVLPARLKNYFDWPWVSGDAMVERPGNCGINPLAKLIDGKWRFQSDFVG